MDERKYEVTIGIPVYNIERYIRKMMESALAQTFQSIEYLICDDCGTDSSIDIVKEYQNSHYRGADIRILRQPHNMGIGEARNRLMAEAKGRFFYSLDGDDSIEENTIELLYQNAQKYNAEIVYGSFDRVFMFDDQVTRVLPCPYPFKVFTEPDAYAMYAYFNDVQCMHWNCIIDIDVIRRNHLKVAPLGHGYGEDFTYTIDLPTYITRAVLLPDITYHYYMRSFSKPKDKKLISRVQLDSAIDAIAQKKKRHELKNKPYYAKRCSMLMMFDYSFACRIISHREEIVPRYSDKEIRNVMWIPMSLREIICSQHARKNNFVAWLLWRMPSKISVWMIRISMSLRH
mgnify:FL=1